MSNESSPPRRRAKVAIALFLAGPVIWYLCFWLVYLLAETACITEGPGAGPLGLSSVSLVTLAVTLASLLAAAWLAGLAVIRWRGENEHRQGMNAGDRRLLHWGGAALGTLFSLAILFVGLPALFLAPC